MDLKRDGAASCRVETPLGVVRIEADEAGISSLRFEDAPRAQVEAGENQWLVTAARQLREYFDGTRHSFDVPLSPAGTDFQRQVWRALADIPFGETRSYRQIAEAAGRPDAARAVGAACGRNPILIMIPCHRALGSDGSLTGFAAGLERKKSLLELEQAKD